MADREPGKPARRKDRGPRNGKVPTAPESGADAMKAGYAKAEIKNQAAREALEPLEEGERPTVVTVGAICSAVVAVLLWGSTVLALAGADAGGQDVNPIQWGFFALVVSAMAWGMWNARYWAVLGFQMILVLLIMAGILGMVVAPTLLQIVATFLLVVGLSLLFWFMVKAMARIQMPERPGR